MRRDGDNIVTIDGPSGVGKSTVARRVAELLGFSCLDTGAMYRAVALKASEAEVDPRDSASLSRVLSQTTVEFSPEGHVFLDGRDVSKLIRTEKISSLSSELAELAEVREFLVGIQRKIGEGENIVAEGRDMGTYVFPGAKYKFYLDATVAERAERRFLQNKRGDIPLSDVEDELRRRDRRDTLRAENPLRPAPDAVVIDTTQMSAEDVIAAIFFRTKDISLRGDSK
ncbi:MAG: (d)CMP kinase [Candidatus Dadabacteria bacterium]|nr:(d)CMP kinase [Candidatus Dadabacteria bacterium]